uniref:Phenolic glucoside malonyltransferase 1 n=2 Tax=Noccaea caerulescens TaxID=107243 RepID=A0A1J3HDM3_NOCCA
MFAGGKEPDNPKTLKHLITPKISPDNFRFTFELSRENIQKLRERLKRDQSSSDSKQLRLSTFVITFSYAFTCLVRSRGGDPKRPVEFRFAVDCRSLLVDPPVPSSYFGNCVSAVVSGPLTATTFMAEDGFLAAARFVSDSVEELDETVAWKLPKVLKDSASPFGSKLLTVAGSTRFGVYGLDFGWGRPEKVEIVSIDQGSISMAESRDGSGGVEIGFSLKKYEIDVLIDLLRDGLKD